MDLEDEEIMAQIKLKHEEENLTLPKKDRKPFVITPARQEQFERCRAARVKNIEIRKKAKEEKQDVVISEEPIAKVSETERAPQKKAVQEEEIKPKTVKKRRITFEEDDDSEVEYVVRRPKYKRHTNKPKRRYYSSDEEDEEYESRPAPKHTPEPPARSQTPVPTEWDEPPRQQPPKSKIIFF